MYKILIKKVFCALLLISLMARGSSAGLIVSDVEIEDKKASIVLSNAIKIRDIRLEKKNGRTILVFPEYVSKSGRVYPQVEVISKSLLRTIKKAVLTEKPEEMTIEDDIEFEVKEPFVLNGKSSRLANVDVHFNDELVVTFGIMKSKWGKNPYWLAPPSKKEKGSGQWFKQVILRDFRLRRDIEKEVFRKFKRTLSEKGEKKKK